MKGNNGHYMPSTPKQAELKLINFHKRHSSQKQAKHNENYNKYKHKRKMNEHGVQSLPAWDELFSVSLHTQIKPVQNKFKNLI